MMCGINTTWGVYQTPRVAPLSDEVHVIPDDDDKSHECSEECPCSPDEDEPGFFIHNSFDQREDFENGRREPS